MVKNRDGDGGGAEVFLSQQQLGVGFISEDNMMMTLIIWCVGVG